MSDTNLSKRALLTSSLLVGGGVLGAASLANAAVTTGTAIKLVDTFAELASTSAAVGDIAQVKSHSVVAGFGGGDFIAKSGSTTNDGGTKINYSGGGIYWERINVNYLSPYDFGAYGNGTTDDNTAVTNAIQTGKSISFRNGTFLVSSKLFPKSNTVWLGDLSGGLKWANKSCLIDAQSIGGWTMQGLIIDGNYSAYSVSSGLDTPWGCRLESSNHIDIFNNRFKNFYRIGLCIGHESVTPCQTIRVHGNTFLNCGSTSDYSPNFGNAIAILSAFDVSIMHNEIHDITGSGGSATAGIDIEPGNIAQHCYDIEIAHNRIYNINNASGIHLYMGHSGEYFTGKRDNINIHNNTINNTGTAAGIECVQFGTTYIRNNYLELTQGIKVQRYKTYECVIEGNDIRQVQTGGFGIKIQDGAAGTQVRGNKLRNIAGVGIQVDLYDLVLGMNVKGCLIQDNELHDVNSHGIAISAGNFVMSGNLLVSCCTTNTTGYYITSLNGGAYQSINGYIGQNTLVSSSTITAFIRCEGDVFNNVTFGQNSFIGSYPAFNAYALSGRCPGVSTNVLPTGGTWKVGDIINCATPTAGGTIGWVCTTAGTPGTFKTFGTIQS